jgi:uncharacterized RmlC-like cupin family protein
MRTAVLATTLLVAISCDKAAPETPGVLPQSPPAAERGAPDGGDTTSPPTPAGRPALATAAGPAGEPGAPNVTPPPSPVLFQVFGERSDARMLPVATIKAGRLLAIRGSAATWRAFDRNYSAAGLRYTLYRDGAAAGVAEIERGMWTGGAPLYALPSCEQPTPLARVRVDASVATSYTVEFLASNAALGRRGGGRGSLASAASQARAIAVAAGTKARIKRSTLDSLDFRAVAIHTGATASPTLVASFVDPNAGSDRDASERDGVTAHVFVIADRGKAGYAPTLHHAVRARAGDAEYVRYVDHLDVDGDGIDEIFVERWRFAGSTALAVLAYQDGEWTEIFRARSNWCLDDVTLAMGK